MSAMLNLHPPTPETPDWLDPLQSTRTRVLRSHRELQHTQFEFAWDSIVEAIAAGATLDNALKDYPIPLDRGLFVRWINASSERSVQYREAKELRTETWAGRTIAHATGEANPLSDVARDRLIVDTYKWLMGADNRKTYGDIKQIDVGGTISITAALQQASAAVERIKSEPIEDIEFREVGTGIVRSISGTNDTHSVTHREQDDGGSGK